MSRKARLLFDILGPRTLARLDTRCEHPMLEQEKLLLRLLEENADTAFGRRHGFASIDTFSAFQKRVPLAEYEDLEPFIEASRRGTPEQLTAEHPVFYAMTSGTTGASKYIPVTERSRRDKAKLMRTWLSGLFRDHPGVLEGKVLQVTSPEIEESSPDGTPCGAEAGHAYRNMPGVMRGVYPVPYAVCEISDYADRYYTLLRIALMESITAIGTPNPSTVLLLARQLEQETERLIRDIRDGKLDAGVSMPPELREEIEDSLEPDPERAAFLEKAAARNDGALTARHAWPEMEVLACWKGGTVGPYLEQLEPYLPEGLPVRDLGWLSSECRGSIPLSDTGDSGPLAIGTNIYEFLPADAENPEPTDLLTVDQIEVGGRYSVYVTTSGGLYRYAMHDILEVTGFHRLTPSVRFVQKEKGIVNFTGEKLTETQVLSAATEALGRGGGNFIAAVGQPGGDSNPSYLFLAEFGSPPAERDARGLAGELDALLSRNNAEYASKRKSGRLDPAILRVLERGEFEAFERRAIQNGARDGQFKILRLTDDPGFAANFENVVGDFAP